MIERIDVVYGGIDIAQSIARLDPRAKVVNCLVERRIDGHLLPIHVMIDPYTWKITVSEDWRPVVAGGIIVALERGEPPVVHTGRGYHQIDASEPSDRVPGSEPPV